MKFPADMGISLRVVSALRERGHEAIHLLSILEKQSAALEKGVVCSVSERKVRIRALPL